MLTNPSDASRQNMYVCKKTCHRPVGLTIEDRTNGNSVANGDILGVNSEVQCV